MSTLIDLSNTPKPDIIEELSFNDILGQLHSLLKQKEPNIDLSPSTVAAKLLDIVAYRELLLRQRINNATSAVMLAYATGADLDNLGRLFSLQRKLIKPANENTTPPEPAVYESDKEYRKRIQLAPYAMTTTGSKGSYIYHTLKADADILDADIQSPKGGQVNVTLLTRSNNGLASQALLEKVQRYLSAEEIRPICDIVKVQTATLVEYRIEATLYFYPGSDQTSIMLSARENLHKYIHQTHKLGHDVTISGIHNALHQQGVQRIELTAPTANLRIEHNQVSSCIGISLSIGGIDE